MRADPSSQAALLLDQIKRHRVDAQAPIEEVYEKLVRKRQREATIGSAIPSTHTRVRAPWPRRPAPSGSSA